MTELLKSSLYFSTAISLGAYGAGVLLRRKWDHPLLNPLLIAVMLTIFCLVCLGIDYQSYNEGARYLSYLLTPATICLAVPMYEQFEILRKNYRAVLAGISAGVMTSLMSILLLTSGFHMNHAVYVTFLPKSITSAIGIGVSEQLGGLISITAAVIILTGIIGNVSAVVICRFFNIHDPIAKGIAIGTAAHAIGTVKAMEMGKVEGAMSSLSIVVAGLLTSIGASIFANFDF